VIRQKTTVYLDPEVLTAAKVLGAARGQSESRVVEDALRSYLRSAESEAAREDLRRLMERLAARADMDEDTAMALAVEEVRSVRAARRARRPA
jgi:hypothetical protein